MALFISVTGTKEREVMYSVVNLELIFSKLLHNDKDKCIEIKKAAIFNLLILVIFLQEK